MKRFLSIDWDFFIDATAEERAMLFPDGGNENLNLTLRNFIWDSRYRDPRLSEIRVSSPDYLKLLDICNKFRGKCFIADSHRFSYDFIMDNTDPDEEFEVYNVDFHHDLYNYRTGDERVNCGNWGTILFEDRPKMNYVWIMREDSDLMTIGGVPVDVERWYPQSFTTNFFDGFIEKFDYLYLCRSAMWSPPHLDDKFVTAAKRLLKNNDAFCEEDILKPRPYEVPTDFPEYKASLNMVHNK